MNKTHEQQIDEIFERLLADDDYKNYKREDFEDFFWQYHVDGDDNVPMIAHIYVPKGAVGDPIEIFSPKQVENAVGDIIQLKKFVQEIAEGKVPTVEEANTVLKSLTNEPLY